MTDSSQHYDTVVIGGGIAGQEAALNMANMDYKVLLVEKGLSIGGKMIQLSKVFPTLDCAACITTPKMSETARHPNIRILLQSDIESINRENGEFRFNIRKHPRYVIPEACTGCQECEQACPEVRPDEYNRNLAGRKVAYIPFSLANPRIASIDRQDESAPCIAACPGGVKPYGYISLVRNGQFEEAMNLHLEDNPLPGSLGRACYAPCQGECTRGSVDSPVDIRRIKRFFAEEYYSKHPDAASKKIEISTGKSIAVIGSGPAGLTAAYFLAQKGHRVKIFEAAPELGGMLRMTLPEYRLPNSVVDRDIRNILSLGVEYEVNRRIENIGSLKNEGFDAVFISVGTHETVRMKEKGTELDGIVSCLDFLRESKTGVKQDLSGKKVLVIGGGNTAMDASRTALRLGAASVKVIYRRSREEMPAWKTEIHEAEEEGVVFDFFRNPVEFKGESGRITHAVITRMKPGEPEADGRKRPVPVPGSEYDEEADLIIEAIGLKPTTSAFSKEIGLRKDGTISVDEKTLQTATPWIFAGGDAVSGSSTIIEAAGQGKRAAFYIDRYLKGEIPGSAEFGDKLAPVRKEKVLSEKVIPGKPLIRDKMRPPMERVHDFRDVEITFTGEEAIQSAERCLDCSNCRECHQCIEACPANAIDFSQKEETIHAKADSVIISSGFRLFDPDGMPRYGSGKYPNVIDSLQMDRLIAPTRPFNNVLRPGDGKVPGNIAYILCTGSRDSSIGNFRSCSTAASNNPICSQICCMYSIKQAQLLMGALPLADITIYYMDIRAFGKGYEEFFQQSKSMGINFVKGKVGKIREKENGDLILRFENVETGQVKELTHDLVVLSVGIQAGQGITSAFGDAAPELDEFRFVRQADPLTSPAKTTMEGVFVAGTAAAPMDIPDSILSAGCAAAEAAGYLHKHSLVKTAVDE